MTDLTDTISPSSHNIYVKRTISIRARLILTFSICCLLVIIVAVVAVSQEVAMATRAALLEAENVAITIAQFNGNGVTSNPELLQKNLKDLIRNDGSSLRRDIAFIDLNKRILADVDEEEIGRLYTADQSGGIDRTLKDGVTRTFVEPAEFYNGYPLEMIAVALRQNQGDHHSPIIGAVLMEYTPIYDELMTRVWPMIYIMIATSIFLLLIIFVLASRISGSISRPLGELKSSVKGFAMGDFSARVKIKSADEIGSLASAFNKMAEDIQISHAELIKHEQELEERVVERTQQVEFMAYHDSLTSLPNRSMFSKLLNQNIDHAHRQNKKFAVLFIDLDRFKNINDTLGHEAGDKLLQEAGVRIKKCLRSGDIVARLGGDEFVVILPEYDDEVDGRRRTESVAHKIITTIAMPFNMLGQDFRITASIGISTYPGDGEDEVSLTKTADIAMYQAKDSGKNNYQFYSKHLYMQSFERLALESSLRRAMEHDEFQLYYQAKINILTGEVTGMEVLIRWQHPDLGMVSPVKFIPIAEETGLIVPIGKWVLKTACLQNVAWHESGVSRLPIAVNLSVRQFTDDHLLDDITTILQETGMSPRYLELEITESMIMHDVDKAIKVLSALKKMGVHIAIDDFGTGYSSLSTLEKFPVDIIKVDRSFIRDLPGNSANKAITEAIITMGKTLGMTVVAEGVETEVQLDFLREHACDQLQGFYFNKPMPADKFAEFLQNYPTPAVLTEEKKRNIG